MDDITEITTRVYSEIISKLFNLDDLTEEEVMALLINRYETYVQLDNENREIRVVYDFDTVYLSPLYNNEILECVLLNDYNTIEFKTVQHARKFLSKYPGPRNFCKIMNFQNVGELNIMIVRTQDPPCTN